jgi:hypothetical protein
VSFKKDIKLLIQSWSQITFFWKVLTTLMILMQISSLASISDTVFQFRGFIATGIEMYRYISLPIASLGNKYGLHYSTSDIDLVVLLVIFWVVPLLSFVKRAHRTIIHTDSIVFIAPVVLITFAYGLVESNSINSQIYPAGTWMALSIGTIWFSFLIAMVWIIWQVKPILGKAMVFQFSIGLSALFSLAVVAALAEGLARL